MPGLRQRYDATVGVTQVAGAVSQWNDQSDGARHLTQVTPASQPTYSATGFDGARPGVTFDGVADIMLYNSLVGLFAANGNTIYIVVKPIIPSPGKFIFAENSSLASQPYYGYRCSTVAGQAVDLDAFVRSDTGASYSGIVAPGGIIANAPVLLELQDLGTTRQARVNGVPMSGVVVARTGTFTFDRFSIGASCPSSGPTNFYNVTIAEIITCTSIHTLEQIQYNEGMLAWKWGLQGLLPVDHPYKSAAP